VALVALENKIYMKIATNCILINSEGGVLLSMKKRGFGVGNWNGSGGKVQPGETVEQTAIREVQEEIGVQIDPKNLEKVGEIHYSKPDDSTWGMFVHIFIARSWTGEPTESEEMKPAWFKPNEIPFENTWADMPHWLPRILNGYKIKAEFVYENDGKKVKDMKIDPLL
jgi:mutator protein MutT